MKSAASIRRWILGQQQNAYVGASEQWNDDAGTWPNSDIRSVGRSIIADEHTTSSSNAITSRRVEENHTTTEGTNQQDDPASVAQTTDEPPVGTYRLLGSHKGWFYEKPNVTYAPPIRPTSYSKAFTVL
jgi:hypothetical protein